MEIKEWLSRHPLINAYSIEKALGLPIGTIKKGRNVPEKYLGAIGELLREYGYDTLVEKEKPVEVIKTVTGSKYFTRKGSGGILICYREGIVRPVQGIPDDTPVTLGG
jgi:hypothetical protein